MISRGSSCVPERHCKFAFPDVAYFLNVTLTAVLKSEYADIQAAAKADIAVLYNIIAYLNPPTHLNLTLTQFFTLQRLQIDSQCCIIVKV